MTRKQALQKLLERRRLNFEPILDFGHLAPLLEDFYECGYAQCVQRMVDGDVPMDQRSILRSIKQIGEALGRMK